MKLMMTMIAGLFFALGIMLARAQDQQPLTPSQSQSYIAILLGDRIAYIKQIDDLRLQLEDQRRAAAAREQVMAAHDAAVDDYWRRYVGLKK